MKQKLISLIPALFLLIAIPSAAMATGNSVTAQKPVATSVNPSFKFSPVPEGVIIQHDFKIKNTGNAILEIQKVKTG